MKNRVLFVFVALSFVAVSVAKNELLQTDVASDVIPKVEDTSDPPKITTPDPKTTTSTAAPPTPAPITTTPKPTPTPPTPVPEPETGMWVYSNKTDNVTCIVIQLAVQWNITYINEDNNPQRTVFNLPISNTTAVDGSCGNDTQFITLQWPVSNISTAYNYFTIHFIKNVTGKNYAINKTEFSFPLNGPNFPNAKANNETTHLEMNEKIFVVPLSRSYRCVHQQAFNVTLPNNLESRGTVTISNLQEQAFLAEKGHSFGSVMDCDGSDSSDSVAIGVGVALAVAVVLVLVGYLFNRHRSQARGYLSM